MVGFLRRGADFLSCGQRLAPANGCSASLAATSKTRQMSSDSFAGIALGLRHQTRDDIEEPFQQTGTLHLFAVAGLHVGIVARLLWTLAMVMRLPRKAATALIIPLLSSTLRSRACILRAFVPRS